LKSLKKKFFLKEFPHWKVFAVFWSNSFGTIFRRINI